MDLQHGTCSGVVMQRMNIEYGGERASHWDVNNAYDVVELSVKDRKLTPMLLEIVRRRYETDMHNPIYTEFRHGRIDGFELVEAEHEPNQYRRRPKFTAARHHESHPWVLTIDSALLEK